MYAAPPGRPRARSQLFLALRRASLPRSGVLVEPRAASRRRCAAESAQGGARRGIMPRGAGRGVCFLHGPGTGHGPPRPEGPTRAKLQFARVPSLAIDSGPALGAGRVGKASYDSVRPRRGARWDRCRGHASAACSCRADTQGLRHGEVSRLRGDARRPAVSVFGGDDGSRAGTRVHARNSQRRVYGSSVELSGWATVVRAGTAARGGRAGGGVRTKGACANQRGGFGRQRRAEARGGAASTPPSARRSKLAPRT